MKKLYVAYIQELHEAEYYSDIFIYYILFIIINIFSV